MKFTSSALVLAAAIGVSAHPSGHAHQRAHNRREFVVAHKPVTVVEYATQVVTAGAPTDVPAPAPTPDYQPPAPAVDPISPPAPKEDAPQEPQEPQEPQAPKEDKPKHHGKQHNKSGSGSGYKPFCGGKKAKRATLEDIAAVGNTGAPGDYGCNIMTVDSDVADEYDYVTTFKNPDDTDAKCVCFNKIGPDGGINGFWKNNQAISFSVPASGSQDVAFEENSQGGCVCSTLTEIPTTSIGQWAGTWLEFDFASERNKGWSGADASCLVSAAHGEDIPGLQVCGHGTCSTIYPGGKGENAYLAGMEDLDGIGLNIKPGKAHLTVTINYSGSK